MSSIASRDVSKPCLEDLHRRIFLPLYDCDGHPPIRLMPRSCAAGSSVGPGCSRPPPPLLQRLRMLLPPALLRCAASSSGHLHPGQPPAVTCQRLLLRPLPPCHGRQRPSRLSSRRCPRPPRSRHPQGACPSRSATATTGRCVSAPGSWPPRRTRCRCASSGACSLQRHHALFGAY